MRLGSDQKSLVR